MRYVPIALVSLLSLSAVLAIAVGTSSVFFPLSGLQADLELGRSLFASRCASCHTIEKGASASFGPSLHSIGEQAATRKDGMSAEAYIFEAITDPEAFRADGVSRAMPRNVTLGLSKSELFSLTAYVCSLGAEPNYGTLVQLADSWTFDFAESTSKFSLSSLENGRSIYFTKGKCHSCHSLSNEPGSGLMAPDLSKVGLRSAEYLRKSIVEPSAYIVDGYESWSVLQDDGRVFSGRRLKSSEETIRLVSLNQNGELIEKSFPSGESSGNLILKREKSLMPAFHSQLESKDIDDLVQFLSLLR